MRRTAGFTLIELLVVVAIIAILARIAVPGYTKYIQRGDMVEGTQALAQYRVSMEQYYQDNHTYAGAGGACGTALPTTMVNFAMTCATSSAGQAYTATATGANAITGLIYTINQANLQQTTGLPSGWSATSAASTSWIVR